MRGKKLSKESRKWDAVLIATRYGADGRLSLAQGYFRRGEVWGDKQLLDREALIEALKQGRRIAAGAPTDIPGEFDIDVPVHWKRALTESSWLRTGRPGAGTPSSFLNSRRQPARSAPSECACRGMT